MVKKPETEEDAKIENGLGGKYVSEQANIKKALLNVISDLEIERSKFQRLNAKNEAIIESITDGLIITDKKGAIVRVNNAFEKLLGFKTKEVLGKDMLDVVVKVDENDRVIQRTKRSLTRVLRGEIKEGKVSTLIATHCYIKKDGSKLPVVGVVAPILLKGRIIGAIQLFRDVTLTKEVIRMKDEFVNIAAHDLRTPAAAIRGFISRVLDGDAGEISEKAKDMLESAYEGNMRLIRLVDEFLVVSRLERGKININPKRTFLESLVEIAVKEVADSARDKGLEVEYKKISLPSVLADQDRIIELLHNLLSNAVKFTSKGKITISHRVEDDCVVTSVVDTGIGIPKNMQKGLFTKYFKISPEEATQSGLGLGLYICRLIMDGHNGRIWVESEEGKGATFSFSLPVVK
jgi:PAS domain S-box-containing protein